MPFFRPEEYLTSVTKIDLGALWRQGTRCLLIDVDNTLLPRDTHVVPPDVRAWVGDARARGFAICLVSNNWHASVFDVARLLEVPIIHKAMKPFPAAYVMARRRLGVGRRQSVGIGDQLMTDVLGSHLSGMRAIKTVPQTHNDLPHTLFLRKIERLLMRDARPTR